MTYELPKSTNDTERQNVQLLMQGVNTTEFDQGLVGACLKSEVAWDLVLARGAAGPMVVILSGWSEKTLQAVARFKEQRGAADNQ